MLNMKTVELIFTPLGVLSKNSYLCYFFLSETISYSLFLEIA